MKRARVWVTYELIRQALVFPVGTDIRFVKVSAHLHDAAEFVIEHPDLRDVTLAEGEEPPLICPTFQKQEPVVLVDWGYE